MKKIYIISYFYPPCTLVAAERSYSWFCHFYKLNLYPIVITRHWNHKVETLFDASTPDTSTLKIEKHAHGEIHYIPYRGSLKDRFINRFGTRYSPFRKMLTLLEISLQFLWIRFNPYEGFYTYLKNLIKQNGTENSGIIISANPYAMFAVGHKISKKYKLPWVADYRDDWTTNDIGGKGVLKKWERIFEKKYLHSASAFTTVNQTLLNRISSLGKLPAEVIMNGYLKLPENQPTHVQTFNVVYNGTLYPSQQIDVFIEGFKRLLEKYPDPSILFHAPGLEVDQQLAARIYEKMHPFTAHYKPSGRLPKADVLKIQGEASILLMVGHQGKAGQLSSKIFEYLSFQKNILLAPGDQSDVELLLRNLGYESISQTATETEKILEENYLFWKNNDNQIKSHQIPNLAAYSREAQAIKLATFLNSLIKASH